jgi:Group II intron, maturase-specific domain
MLSNIYMRRFVKGWKTGGHEKRLAARIVNYADDFVNCCRGTAEEAMAVMRKMMPTLKLTVNEGKTRLCPLAEEPFDFLGYTQGRNYNCRMGQSYLGPRPSRKKIDRLCCEINELTERRKTWQDVEMLIGRINRKLRGWSSYFHLARFTSDTLPVGESHRPQNAHCHRLSLGPSVHSGPRPATGTSHARFRCNRRSDPRPPRAAVFPWLLRPLLLLAAVRLLR